MTGKASGTVTWIEVCVEGGPAWGILSKGSLPQGIETLANETMLLKGGHVLPGRWHSGSEVEWIQRET